MATRKGLKAPAFARHLAQTALGVENWGPKYLAKLLEEAGDVEAAALDAGVSLAAVYEAEDEVPEFAEALQRARSLIKRARVDRVEHATTMRAIKGTPYTRYNNEGGVAEEGSTPDTRAAALILGGLAPERYKQKDVAPAGAEIESVTALVRALADAARSQRPVMTEAEESRQLPAALDAEVVPDGPEPLIRRIVN